MLLSASNCFKPRPLHRVMALSGLLLLNSAATGDDWPQWLGPNRDSTWNEDNIIRKFADAGPVYKWRVAISGGYAGPAVARNRVFVMDYQTAGDQTPNPDQRNALDGTERLLCLDARTGKLLWEHSYPCHYEISYPAGPRATPTVDGDRVFTLGAEGDLHCLDVTDGTLLWARNFKRDYDAETPLWGYCGHPLVDGDHVICIVGGKGSLAVAFDKATGKEVWRSGESKGAGYSAPTIIDAGGTRQLLIWHATALTSMNPTNGTIFWDEPLDPNYGMSIITPKRWENLLFVGGIVNKSMMLRLASDTPTVDVAWIGNKDVGIDPVHSTPIIDDGTMYGVSRQGGLTAVRMHNGQHLWRHFELMPDTKRGNHSGTVFIVRNGDAYFLMTDSGELVIARLTPQTYKELDRIKIIEPTSETFDRQVVWSHPAFANRCVFARNDKEIVCVSLSAADRP